MRPFFSGKTSDMCFIVKIISRVINSKSPLVLLAILSLSSTMMSCKQSLSDLDSPGRIKYSLNDGWSFTLSDSSYNLSETICIPHTWNSIDASDGDLEYIRGTGIYQKEFILDKKLDGKRIFIHFEGINQVSDLLINSEYLEQHRGGYTAFTLEMTDFVTYGKKRPNLLEVRVNNEFNHNIPPLSADFTFYGGIYRDVWLVATDPVHLTLSDHGSEGVYIRTPEVSTMQAAVEVECSIDNQSETPREIQLVSTIYNGMGEEKSTCDQTIHLAADGEAKFILTHPLIEYPELWSPDHPNLYTVHTELLESGKLIDRVKSPLGFRFFRMDPDEGFFLNGEAVKLVGTNRHQDYADLGNALPDSLHVKDMQLIKEAGFNFVRLAHYPQDPAVLDAADSLGLIVWEEIPIVNYVTTTDGFRRNCETMMREMIRQHYNHPSVFFWGYMNEIFLQDMYGKRNQDMVFPEEYLDWTVELAKNLDKISREEDPSRLTAMAVHQGELYNQTGISNIPQAIGYNLYPGWYSGDLEGLGRYLDWEHQKYPERNIMLSEYGAGSDERLHSLTSVPFDFTVEYQAKFMESYLQQILQRPYVGVTSVWVQNDFGSVSRGGTKPGINQKGLAKWDRTTKDCYFLYKANLNPDPMVYIASRDWRYRTGTNHQATWESGFSTVKQPVNVYTNLNQVELLLDGKSLGTKKPDKVGKITWMAPFNHGRNHLKASGINKDISYSDSLDIDFHYRPPILNDPSVPFSSLGVNIGSKAQYTDQDGFVWDADQAYMAGSFGYTGGIGTRFYRKQIIDNQTDTPLYYSFREDITGYSLDVPEGEYQVEFHFARNRGTGAEEAVFHVHINGDFIFQVNGREHAIGAAFLRSYSVSVKSGESLNIRFENISGTTFLNALKISRK